jgi:hypothetical protein
MSPSEVDEFLGRQLLALTDEFGEPVTVAEVMKRVRAGDKVARRRRLAPAAPPVHNPIILVVTCCALAVALAAGLLIVHENGSSRPVLPLSSYQGAIQQLSVDYAAASGDSSPTSVSWVATTRGDADRMFGGGSARSAVPVFALQVSGSFKNPSPGEAGSDLWLVVTRSSWDVTSDVISPTAARMNGLGPSIVDSLAGVHPESSMAWGKQYHHPEPLLQQALDQWAVDGADFFGDPRPTTVTWVAANAAAAEYLLPNTASAGGPAIYAIETEGDFKLTFRIKSGGRSSLAGHVLVAFPSRSKWGLAVGEPVQRFVSLASLGVPETDSLLGLRPMSEAAFVAKYKHVPGVRLANAG